MYYSSNPSSIINRHKDNLNVTKELLINYFNQMLISTIVRNWSWSFLFLTAFVSYSLSLSFFFFFFFFFFLIICLFVWFPFSVWDFLIWPRSVWCWRRWGFSPRSLSWPGSRWRGRPFRRCCWPRWCPAFRLCSTGRRGCATRPRRRTAACYPVCPRPSSNPPTTIGLRSACLQ